MNHEKLAFLEQESKMLRTQYDDLTPGIITDIAKQSYGVTDVVRTP